MITEIKLNNVASYKEETVISDLKKLNFFFGSNGTGKSTIGKYLQALKIAEDKENVKDFELCKTNGYNPDEHEILVFNQQFIEDNFILRNELDGIFTIDEKNKEIEGEIEIEQGKISKWNECLGNLDAEKKRKEDSKIEIYSGTDGVLNKVWNLREDFNKNFIKMLPLEHLKSKENHYKKIVSILDKNEEQDIDYKDLLSEYRKLYEKEISKIEHSFNSFLYRDIRKIEIEINNKLSQPFTGNKDVDIANMIENLGIQKWVEERYYQLDKSSLPQKCPFCQEKTINQDLIKQFEDYFDRTYTEKKEIINKLKKRYNELHTLFVQHLNTISSNYPYKSDLGLLINKLEKFFIKQENAIQDKIDNTNKELSIASLHTHIQDLKTVLKTIASNNKDFENLDEKRQDLIRNIWKYMAFNARGTINDYRAEDKKLDKKLKQIKAIKEYKKSHISKSELIVEEKRKDTANTETARKEINEILKSTGFHGFEIAKKETTENNISRYYLKRPNENRDDVFITLSEGEKNFIAFLYFYWFCKGTDDQDKKKDKKKIIVIDDPISSLDSQALFVVITIIRGLATKKGKGQENNSVFANENISQLIVMTHNLFFQKEVCFKADEFLCKDLHFYSITKHIGKSSVSSPSKKELIKNDYELLWKSLAQVKDDNNLKVIIGNLMRRILQTYLQFTHKEPKESQILDNFSKESNIYLIYRAFMSEINEQSHEIQMMNEFFYHSLNESKIDDLLTVFKEIFNDIGKEHYEKMSRLYFQ